MRRDHQASEWFPTSLREFFARCLASRLLPLPPPSASSRLLLLILTYLISIKFVSIKFIVIHVCQNLSLNVSECLWYDLSQPWCVSAASLVAGVAPRHSRGSLALPISTKFVSTKLIPANLTSTGIELISTRPSSTKLISVKLISIRLTLTNLSLSNLFLSKIKLFFIIFHLISLKLFSAKLISMKLISSKTFHRVRIDRLCQEVRPLHSIIHARSFPMVTVVVFLPCRKVLWTYPSMNRKFLV